MQSVDLNLQQNFFQLFGLHEQFRLENVPLDEQYHSLQTQVHPDKFAHLSEAEKRVSMQLATRVNEARVTKQRSVPVGASHTDENYESDAF
jgi:molecular chaperone HscB